MQQSDGFVRQRRNLMMASLILLFSEVTELKVEKLAVFGTELLVGQPQAVTAILWIATFYWAIRYYQFSRAEYKGTLVNAVQARLYETCSSIALKQFLKENPQFLTPAHGSVKPPEISVAACDVIRWTPASIEVLLTLDSFSSMQEPSHSDNHRLSGLKVSLKGANLLKLRARAWAHSILHTTLFTELVLPYIVFSLPIIYAIYAIALWLVSAR